MLQHLVIIISIYSFICNSENIRDETKTPCLKNNCENDRVASFYPPLNRLLHTENNMFPFEMNQVHV